MVGENWVLFSISTEELCQLSSIVVGDRRGTVWVSVDPTHYRHKVKVTGEPVATLDKYVFYTPEQVRKIQWISSSRRDKIEIQPACLSEGQWIVRFEGEPVVSDISCYYASLLLVRPYLDLLAAVKLRIELGVLATEKTPKERRKKRLEVEAILREETDAQLALWSLDLDIRQKLYSIPEPILLSGLSELMRTLKTA